MHLPDTIEHLPTDALVPYARNSRTHSIEQVGKVADSIRRFGFTNPILVRGDTIIAGHGRVMAAKALDMATVPVIRLDHLTEDEARAYVIADNKLAELAGWDDDLLALELRELQGHGFDLGLTGFTDAEVNELLFTEPEAKTDPDAAPAVQAEAVSRAGDIWVLGAHRVMCGDSTSTAAVALLMNGVRTDAVLTDPPYGLGKKMSGGTWATNDSNYAEMHEWDKVADQRFFDEVVSLGVPSIVWGGNYFNVTASRGWLVWNKPHFPTMSDCELAWTNIDMNTKRFDGVRVHQSDGKRYTRRRNQSICWFGASIF